MESTARGWEAESVCGRSGRVVLGEAGASRERCATRARRTATGRDAAGTRGHGRLLGAQRREASGERGGREAQATLLLSSRLSLSPFITRVAPHRVNTLRLLHAAYDD